jgi:hypothetical protein
MPYTARSPVTPRPVCRATADGAEETLSKQAGSGGSGPDGTHGAAAEARDPAASHSAIPSMLSPPARRESRLRGSAGPGSGDRISQRQPGSPLPILGSSLVPVGAVGTEGARCEQHEAREEAASLLFSCAQPQPEREKTIRIAHGNPVRASGCRAKKDPRQSARMRRRRGRDLAVDIGVGATDYVGLRSSVIARGAFSISAVLRSRG